MHFICLAITAFISTVFAAPEPSPYYDNFPINAIAVFSNDSVSGTVTFKQEYRHGPTEVHANITGLVPNTKHGFHIHEFGDLSNGCESLGPHYNPFKQDHGGPFSTVRHVGDFGNVEQGSDEKWATLSLTIDSLQLSGATSVLGRGIVLHAGEDDLGLGDSPASKATGNSGARLACGIIGFAQS